MHASNVTGFSSEIHGFPSFGLDSGNVKIEIIPELGARIVSLQQAAQEWLWHPNDGRGLFASTLGTPFAKSPLWGADECLPTVAGCHWKGRSLPDHGEVWALPWEFDKELFTRRRKLKTTVLLPASPFRFTRTISLEGSSEILLDYQLENLSLSSEEFLWAWHPLFQLGPQDWLELPQQDAELVLEVAKNPDAARGDKWRVRSLLQGAPDSYLKGFLPAGNGECALCRPNGTRLQLRWNPSELPLLGIWISRGGWDGFWHVALEPTHGAPDALDVAVTKWKQFASIAAMGKAHWRVRLALHAPVC